MLWIPFFTKKNSDKLLITGRTFFCFSVLTNQSVKFDYFYSETYKIILCLRILIPILDVYILILKANKLDQYSFILFVSH